MLGCCLWISCSVHDISRPNSHGSGGRSKNMAPFCSQRYKHPSCKTPQDRGPDTWKPHVGLSAVASEVQSPTRRCSAQPDRSRNILLRDIMALLTMTVALMCPSCITVPLAACIWRTPQFQGLLAFQTFKFFFFCCQHVTGCSRLRQCPRDSSGLARSQRRHPLQTPYR